MSQKNHLKLIIILSVLFSIIFGIGLGFYINQVFNLSSSLNPDKQSGNTLKKEKITFLLKENKQIKQEDINKFQDVFAKGISGKSYEINVQVLKSPARNNIPDRNKKRQENFSEFKNVENFIMIDDTFKVIRANKKGISTAPLFQLSPFPNEKCYAEVQFIAKKTSTLTDIEQAKFQNIAILNIGLNIATMKIAEMGKRGMHFKTLLFVSDINEGLELINTGEYAALAIRTNQTDKNTITSLLGTFTDNKYPDFPDFKQIGITNYKIPCKVMFMKNNSRKDIVDEFSDKFYKYTNTPEGNAIFQKLTGLSNIEILSSPEWVAIENLYLSEDHNTEIEKYADKIFRKSFAKPAPPKK